MDIVWHSEATLNMTNPKEQSGIHMSLIRIQHLQLNISEQLEKIMT